MSVAATITRFLEQSKKPYKVHDVSHIESIVGVAKKLRVPPTSLVYAVALNDRFGVILAVLSSHRVVDYQKLSKLMGRKLEPATTAQTLGVFRDCDGVFVPPLGEAYGVRSIMDDEIVDNDMIYMLAGDSRHIIQLRTKDFIAMQGHACVASGFTRDRAEEVSKQEAVPEQTSSSDQDQLTPEAIKDALLTIDNLPPMPEMAQKIFSLASDPYADAKALSEIINIDPSLTAQVLRYARSPLFGYTGELDSVQTAISRVLGFDMVLNLALGIATSKPFKVQRLGPLGLDGFWRHSIYSAALAQALAKEVTVEPRPNPGMAYLAGLLHNFGHLIMGHMFKKEFAELNERVKANPDTPVIDIEERIFGMGHDELGAQIMHAWSMPEQIVVAAREHHSLNYEGVYDVYPRLVMLTDIVLKGHMMGDADTSEVPDELMQSLGLNEVQILRVMNKVLEGCEGFNTMAQQLAA